jgi:hypothetical protein
MCLTRGASDPRHRSLNVLMSVGLIQSLVGFLEVHLAAIGADHRCPGVASEAGPSEDSDSVLIPAEKMADDGPVSSFSDADLSPEKEEATEEGCRSSAEGESDPSTDGGVAVTAAISNDGEKTAAVVASGPVFRINSPSYQAVQHELEQFIQLRESHAAAASDGPASANFPGSPRSICLSPDRSPLSLSCGYSPDRSNLSSLASSAAASPVYSPSPSDWYSPTSSPPCSPQATIDFTPILNISNPPRAWGEEETFSDEVDSGHCF